MTLKPNCLESLSKKKRPGFHWDYRGKKILHIRTDRCSRHIWLNIQTMIQWQMMFVLWNETYLRELHTEPMQYLAVTISLISVHSLSPSDAICSQRSGSSLVQVTAFNLLWFSDAIWHHRTWSTSVQEMACCLTAPSHYVNPCWPNSLWPSDAIWRQRTMSTLAQVMSCCLTAPSHYLNQC